MHFNEKFNAMMHLKNDVVRKSAEMLKKQVECKSELEKVFGVIPENDRFCNINWCSIEDPEVIFTLSEKDVTYSYESNFYEDDDTLDEVSQMNPTDNLTEEQIRFRKRKLKEMMDGVLEIRF